MTSRKKAAVDVDNIPPEKQAKLIEEFRVALTEAGCDEDQDDATLLRFLKARQLVVPQSTQMLMAHLDWRKKHKVDEIVFDIATPEKVPYPVRGYECWPDCNPDVSAYPSLDVMSKFAGGSCFHKFSKGGHPVYIERIGLHEAKNLAKIPIEHICHHHLSGFEFNTRVLMPGCSKVTGLNVECGITIMDCEGLGMHQMHKPILNVFKTLSELAANNYPERMYRTYIVKAPKVFTMFWSAVKGMLDPRVLSKLKIYGFDDFQKDLLEEIDADSLPSFLGGNCKCEHIEGGCVPSKRLDALKIEFNKETFVEPRAVFTHEIKVREASLVKYAFKTEGVGMSFHIQHVESKKHVVMPSAHESHIAPTNDVIVIEEIGTYILTWDNAGSKLRKRKLWYNVEVEKHEGEEA